MAFVCNFISEASEGCAVPWRDWKEATSLVEGAWMLTCGGWKSMVPACSVLWLNCVHFGAWAEAENEAKKLLWEMIL